MKCNKTTKDILKLKEKQAEVNDIIKMGRKTKL